MLMKFWNNAKPTSTNASSSTTAKSPMLNQMGGNGGGGNGGNGRNPKMANQPIGYQRNNNDQRADNNITEPIDLDPKIKDINSKHNDFKKIHNVNNNLNNNNNNNNCSNTNIMHTSISKDSGCGDTYEDGIAKDIRELERRLESELEEHEKLWSPTEEISQT